jgi:hypothetical protein
MNIYYRFADCAVANALKRVLALFAIPCSLTCVNQHFELPADPAMPLLIVWSSHCDDLDTRNWLIKFNTELDDAFARPLAVLILDRGERALVAYLMQNGASTVGPLDVVTSILRGLPQNFRPKAIRPKGTLSELIRSSIKHGVLKIAGYESLLAKIAPWIAKEYV